MGAVDHHMPPRPGVTELRVHGVGGTPPESLLNQTGVTQITGDDTAGLYRGVIPVPGRTVEAYSWGGLTTRSRSRAFWILLLPFSLVNIAGWMVEPRRDADGVPDTTTRTAGIRVHEAVVAIIAVLTTALYVMWAALLSMNALAFQCGAIPQCREDRWYVDFLGAEFFNGHAGRRVVVGLAVPLLMLVLFVGLGRLSRIRYDDFGNQQRRAETDGETRSVLGDASFWYTSGWQSQLSSIHVAVVLLLLAGLLGRASSEFEKRFPEADVVPDIGMVLFWACVVIAVVISAVLFAATLAAKDTILEGDRTLRWTGRLGLTASIVLLASSAWLTWHLDVADKDLVDSMNGVIRPVTDLWGFGWAPILLLAMAVAAVGVFSVVQLWRWLSWSQVYLDQMTVVVILAFIAFWSQAPLVAGVAALAAIAVEVVQWLTATRRRAVSRTPQWWRLGLYVLVLAVGVTVWAITSETSGPYGRDWPRLTPLITFAALLAAFNVVRLAMARAGHAAALALAIPGAIVLAGYVTASVTERNEWRYAAVGLSLVILSVVWLAQHPFDGWRWNGPAATAVLGLSVLMGTFSGGALRLADFLDRDGTEFEFSATGIYEWLVIGFVAMLGAGLIGLVVWFVLVKFHAPVSGDGPKRVETRAEAFAEGLRGADVAITMIALGIVFGALALAAHLLGISKPAMEWIDFGVPPDWSAILDWATWIVIFLVVTVFAFVRSALRDPAARRRLGTLWDVASFWPRNFHPFAPPAYASRAVPELQARILEITNEAHGATIVSAHSQGTVLAASAVASLPLDARRRVVLITHGSPLRRFYQRFFPRYFPNTFLSRIGSTIGPSTDIADGSWLNYWRTTDPIGSPVFRGITERSGAPPPGVATALAKSRFGSADCPDIELDDPVPAVSAYQLENKVRGHPGYMADPAMYEAIDAWATLLGQRQPPSG